MKGGLFKRVFVKITMTVAVLKLLVAVLKLLPLLTIRTNYNKN